MTTEPEVIIEQRGQAGLITLNRPRALNALTHGIVREVLAALNRWVEDAAVTRVIIRGAGEKAFCAGGDIRAVHDLGKAGKHGEALAFFRDEYIMNRTIKRYPKPYVALLDGIVMGGGFGISVHGSHRVAGDRFSFAMPEVGIGFFPDVGGTFVLPRLPFEAGRYLALTGGRINRGDAMTLGIATHAVPSARFEMVVDALVTGGDIEATLKAHAAPVDSAPILTHRDAIARIFAGGSVPAIMAALERDGGDFALATLAMMRSKSPTSMAIALEQMKRGPALSFEACMTTEMRIVTRILDGTDFYEGVRSVIIDKDQKPQWQPASIEAVDPADITRYFAPMANDLEFAS
ncbi:MAG: enoyl-CoA hydratase/isomerase family protein [Proteobacteria bacterium]|nr:enoyl-CoA hydratase/isomerase family protein [Pseudomonadota bacterium]